MYQINCRVLKRRPSSRFVYKYYPHPPIMDMKGMILVKLYRLSLQQKTRLTTFKHYKMEDLLCLTPHK